MRKREEAMPNHTITRRTALATAAAAGALGTSSARAQTNARKTFVFVPGAYHGCIPLQGGQRGWATR